MESLTIPAHFEVYKQTFEGCEKLTIYIPECELAEDLKEAGYNVVVTE